MARVLLSAPANKPWCTGPHLEAALRELGCEVRLVDFRSARRPDDELVGAAAALEPALHVMWKGEVYSPATLRTLAARGIYQVVWQPDALVPPWLPPLAEVADLCCVQSRGMLPALRAAGIADPQWLMEGVTPSCFACGELSAADRRRFGCEVVLIGTVSHKPGYRRRAAALNRLAREGVRVRWWGRRLPLRLGALREWLAPVGRAWGGGKVWGGSYAKACRCARVFLAVPFAPDIPGGLSTRAFMATALGTLYLSLYRAGMEEFFELGEEVAVFHDDDEMVAQVRHYLAHAAERQAVAAAGQRRTLACYTNHHAFRRLFRIVAERGGPDLTRGDTQP